MTAGLIFENYLPSWFDSSTIFDAKVLPKKDDSLTRASRNLPYITPTIAASLNITDILKADSMVILKESLEVIEKTYLREVKKVVKE